MPGLVEALVAVADREHRHALALLLGEVGQHRGGVDAAREEQPERNVRTAAPAHGDADPVVEFVGEVGGARRASSGWSKWSARSQY